MKYLLLFSALWVGIFMLGGVAILLHKPVNIYLLLSFMGCGVGILIMYMLESLKREEAEWEKQYNMVMGLKSAYGPGTNLLNGHFHAPAPPIKTFSRATEVQTRRQSIRIVKTDKQL